MNSNKSVKQKFKTIIDFTVLLAGALLQNCCSSFVTKLFDVSIRMIVYPFLLVLIYNVIHFILYSFKSEFVWYVIYC